MSETTYRFENEFVAVTVSVDEKPGEAWVYTVATEQPAPVTKKIRVNQDYVKGYGGKPFLLDGEQVNSVEILGPSRVLASDVYDPKACKTVRHAWIETEAEVLSK